MMGILVICQSPCHHDGCPGHHQVRRQLEAATGPAGERLLTSATTASSRSATQVPLQLTSDCHETDGRSPADSDRRRGSGVKRRRTADGAHRDGDPLVLYPSLRSLVRLASTYIVKSRNKRMETVGNASHFITFHCVQAYAGLGRTSAVQHGWQNTTQCVISSDRLLVPDIYIR